MSEIVHLETIADMYRLLPTASMQHPQVAVVDFSKHREQFNSGMKITLGFYAVMFKNFCANKMKYGQKPYDFDNGSLICISPRQVISLDAPLQRNEEVDGWGLFFHPGLIHGTALGNSIKSHSFFSYEMNEALHLSDKERIVLLDIISKISLELAENIDKHSRTLMVSNIELLLNYCSRY